MKRSSAVMRLARAALALALFAAPLPPAGAQDMLCCGMFISNVGKWTGMLRTCSQSMLAKLSQDQLKSICEQMRKADKECPEVDKLCPCDEERLKQLKGRMKGLSEASAAFTKEITKTDAARSNARDRLWGKGEGLKFEGGSISRYGQSVLDTLMVAGGGSGVGKVVEKANDVSDWANQARALAKDPTSLDEWSEYGQKVIGMKADEVLKQASTNALREARETFYKTRNVYSAQAQYKKSMGNYGDLKEFKQAGEKITNFLGAIEKLADLWKKTDTLANDLQDWADAFGDNTRAKAEKDKIDDQMARTQREIDRLNAACGKKAGLPWNRIAFSQGGTGSSLVDAPISGFLEAQAQETGWVRLQIAQADKGGDAKARAATNAKILGQAQRAIGMLRRVQERFNYISPRFGSAIVAPLSPWLAGTARQAEPRQMLPILAIQLEGNLSQFKGEMGTLASYATQSKFAVEAIPPDTLK